MIPFLKFVCIGIALIFVAVGIITIFIEEIPLDGSFHAFAAALVLYGLGYYADKIVSKF